MNSPQLEEDFDYGSGEELLFEFRVPLLGEYQVWVPLDLVRNLIWEISDKVSQTGSADAVIDDEYMRLIESMKNPPNPRILSH